MITSRDLDEQANEMKRLGLNTDARMYVHAAFLIGAAFVQAIENFTEEIKAFRKTIEVKP